MKDKYTLYTIITFVIGVIVFVHPEIFPYFIASCCVYIFVMTIIDVIKDKR